MATIVFHSTGTLSLNGTEISSKTSIEELEEIFPGNQILKFEASPNF